jgi:hypothetical protein
MPRRRAPIDFSLKLYIVPVNYLSGKKGQARAEGNNAAWICECEDKIPLVGRCSHQFDGTCFTVCPCCQRKYRVKGRRLSATSGCKTVAVDEI